MPGSDQEWGKLPIGRDSRTAGGRTARARTAGGGAAYAVLMLALVLIPIVIMLGVARSVEAALYITAAILLLVAAGWTLLELVLAPRSQPGE